MFGPIQEEAEYKLILKDNRSILGNIVCTLFPELVLSEQIAGRLLKYILKSAMKGSLSPLITGRSPRE